ncbi:MAG: cupin domain-containing protein [Balneolaceae bacterium]|jgi:quercetin dioxygenase-like cupin family protein
MIFTNLNNLELQEFIAQDDESQHCKATFPLFGAHGTSKGATVYFELKPGHNLGRHTDSSEELLLIIEGSVEVSVGKETAEAGENSLVLVPEMIPHDIKNIGNSKARVLGFFGGDNNIIATFEKTWNPTNSNVVDTSKMY